MTSDDDKDPPVPAHLEGISLKRVHDGQVLGEPDPDDTTSPQTQGRNS